MVDKIRSVNNVDNDDNDDDGDDHNGVSTGKLREQVQEFKGGDGNAFVHFFTSHQKFSKS